MIQTIDGNEPDLASTRIETKGLVIGYAMSRLDGKYLESRRLPSWSAAYKEASGILGHPQTSFKNLRDEFDPYFANSRKGWHLRAIRTSRQKVLDELADVSDEALCALVEAILYREEADVIDAIDSLIVKTRVVHNVAQRLLTGRLAEEYFLEHTNRLLNIDRCNILDYRQSAIGYDFGNNIDPLAAIEVKGMKGRNGSIQFTDHEWSVARIRRESYVVVVVGNIETTPAARIIIDPTSVLEASCSYQTSITASWRSNVSVI